jgi:hypothetical protein
VFEERIAQLLRDLGTTKRDATALAGLSTGILNTWITRARDGKFKHGLPGEDFYKLCSTYMMNPAWFLSDGATYERWNPEMVAAQRELRKWARTANYDTPRERLVAVWDKLHQLAPTLDERVWAAYLKWTVCEWEPSTNNSNPQCKAVHMSEWLSCKQGTLNPSEMQLHGAALLTGLPLKWLQTGDVQYIREVELEQAMLLVDYANADGLEIEDIIRHYKIARMGLR